MRDRERDRADEQDREEQRRMRERLLAAAETIERAAALIRKEAQLIKVRP